MAPRKSPTFGAIIKKAEKLFQEGVVTVPLGNDSVISVNSVIPENYNTVLYGPVTIDSDATLVVGDNADLIILKLTDANPVEVPAVKIGGEKLVSIDGTPRIVDRNNSNVTADILVPDHDTIFYDPVKIFLGASLRIQSGAVVTISSIDDAIPIKVAPEIQIGGDSIVSIDGTLRVIDRNDSTIRADSIVQKHDIDTVLYGPVTIDSGRHLKIAEDSELKITTVSDVGGLYSSMGNPTSMNTTILDNYNAVLFGPITVNEGDSFKIGDGSAAKIVNISDAFSAIKYN